MAKNISKRKKQIKNFTENNISYSFTKGMDLLKRFPKTKFNETIDISINLQIYPKNKNINIKGFSYVLNNLGKTLKIAAFLTEEKYIQEAKRAKIDTIINEKTSFNKKTKLTNFDTIITTPSCILKMGKLSKILGQKNLMPSLKYGTITTNIYQTIKNIKTNYIKFRSDKTNIIHCAIGKINLDTKSLKENIENIITDIKKFKPINCKNIIIKKLTISSTMGPGINIKLESLNTQ